MTIVWEPQPGPQTWLLSCPVEDVLFGGARGGGKSDALLGDWVGHASRSNGHANGVLFRQTTPQLDEIIARSREIYPRLGAEWLASKHTWRFPCGSRLKMRWLERDADADNYQGHSYSWLGWDELGNWESPDPVDKLRATLRSAHGVHCVSRGTANPGGVGHQWIKERYILPARPLTPFYDEKRRVQRVFIPSRLQDNRKLIEADPKYLDRLHSSGPPWLVKAWLEGDWDASAGKFLFPREMLLVDGEPVAYPNACDSVFAVVDCAIKGGQEHDGTGITWWAHSTFGPHLLVCLDWDLLQVDGALLEQVVPHWIQRGVQLAKECRARFGFTGLYIEDAAAGSLLLQQCEMRNLPAEAAPSDLFKIGKDGRAMNASGPVQRGEVKISAVAYNKNDVTFKEVTMNHLLSQVCGYKLGDKAAARRADDLFDSFAYAVAIGCGNSDGIS